MNGWSQLSNCCLSPISGALRCGLGDPSTYRLSGGPSSEALGGLFVDISMPGETDVRKYPVIPNAWSAAVVCM